jgi:hypothetical protein
LTAVELRAQVAEAEAREAKEALARFFGTAISGSEAEFGRDGGIADVDERALVGETPLLP